MRKPDADAIADLAIANFIEGTQAIWKDCYRYGWRIVKCEIIIKP